MSKRVLDKAIESIELDLRDVKRAHQAELAAVNDRFHGRIEGMEATITALKAQKARKSKPRQPKPSAAEPAG